MADMASQPAKGKVQLTCDNGLAAITLSNPTKRNAMSLVMWQDLREQVRQADSDPSVRLITVRGENGTFVSGADISEFEQTFGSVEQAKAYEHINSAAFTALRNARKPTLALIEGACFGGGIGIAAACDLRLAADTAKFCVPAAKLGLAYPVDAIADVVALIGASATKHMFYTATTLGAQEALRLGFLNQISAQDQFEDMAKALSELILSRAPLTQQAAKLAVNAVFDQAQEEQAQAAADACFASKDYAEGRQAFLEKRAPRFTGN